MRGLRPLNRALIPASAVRGDRITITDAAELRHLIRVRRVRVGEPLECVDGSGRRYTGRVAQCSAREMVVALEASTSADRSSLALTLAHALIKPDRFAWALQKATELGAARIIPLVTARGIVRLREERVPGQAARWQRIVREAVKQCGRATIPILEPPQRLNALAMRFPEWPLVLMPTLAVPVRPLRDALAQAGPVASALVLIGPEGDFTSEEAALAQGQGAVPVSLGPLTLRSETAAVASLAILQHVMAGI